MNREAMLPEDVPSYDWSRNDYLADQADAENDELAILKAVEHWKCCGCKQDCAVSIVSPFIGATSLCCRKPAYNADDSPTGADQPGPLPSAPVAEGLSTLDQARVVHMKQTMDFMGALLGGAQ